MTRILAALLLLAASSPARPSGRVAGSKHDFSASGPGRFRAESERSPCIFCHVSHGAGAGSLSNRPETAARHVPYESTTLTGRPAAPTGASRTCLSCHDGTIAVGQTRTGRIRMAGGDVPLRPGERAHLGTDLRGSHPVSLRVPPSRKVHEPAQGDGVRLDRYGQVQCTSCHDPHDEWGDPAAGKFLVRPESVLCSSCHSGPISAAAGTHASSQAPFRDPATGRTRTMAEAGCTVCHVSHAGAPGNRLLRPDRGGDGLCLECHGVSGAKPIAGDVQKPSSHALHGGNHDAAEGPDAPSIRAMPERSAGAERHVACVDCHDPHASNPMPSQGAAVGGALAGVWGIDLGGQPVSPARNEYEVCLKCHGDSANKPQAFGLRRDGVRRAEEDTNLRLVFAPGAASSHPVAAPGRGALVPSLRPEHAAGALIRCTDCHASDGGPGAGGTGARGPHGSIYPFLLERQYRTADFTPEGPDAYALCYKCHDRRILLSGSSTFPLHRRHVVEISAPCSACHDAHGISAQAGTAQNNAHLVSFDRSIVRTGQGGVARYDSAGPGHGSCNLSCHGTLHAPNTNAFAY